MKPEERIQTIPNIRDMAERYFAIACHDLLIHLENFGQVECVSNHAAIQYQKGMKKFFQIKVTVDDKYLKI